MIFSIKNDIPAKQTINCLILPILSGNYSSLIKKIDSQVNGQLIDFLKTDTLSANMGKTAWLIPTSSNIKRILLVSLTDKHNTKTKDQLSTIEFRNVIQAVAQELKFCPEKKAMFAITDINITQTIEWQLMQIVKIINNSWYTFDVFKQKPSDKRNLTHIDLITEGTITKEKKSHIDYAQAIIEGMGLAKDLGNMPGNVCTPTYMATEAQKIAKTHKKMKCTILDEKKLRSLKMNTLLSVGEGSAQPSKLICLQFMNATKKQPIISLVGKGITFDSGGISIKPSAKMDEMKYDMCGAASVLGTLKAIAMLDLPVNVVAVIASAENMPGSKATRPGDIVKSMSGKTVEILNTDAEGRLVLCDALTYVQKFNPTTIIDIATLTGACVVALGRHNSGLFSNDDKLANDLKVAAKETDDPIWQLPLGEEYAELLRSNFADVANIGGPYAGSITAACFLEKFISNCKWAHLDIAGTAWLSGNKKGATGRPVPLLVKYLINSIV